MPSNSNIQPKVHPALELPSFYNLIDKAACVREGYAKMNHYEKTRKKGQRRITPNTIDIFHAILRSVPATMVDMQKHQPEVFIEAIEKEEFFCFTTTQSLITLANNTQEYKHIRMSKKTAYNHIQLLMDIGIIPKKENYNHTGYRNPRPEDENTNGKRSGRGKMKLYLSPQIIHIKMGKTAPSDSPTPSFFAPKEETLQQYILSKESTLFYKSTDKKTISDTPQTVDNKAFAGAKSSPSNIRNTERESKPLSSKAPTIPPANLTHFDRKTALDAAELQRKKKGMLEAAKRAEEKVERNNAARLWDFMCQQLYPGQVFNALARAQCVDLLQGRLKEAKRIVDEYRKTKIAQYQQNPAYLVAKNKEKALQKFQTTLPDRDQSAFVMVANMIEKERKYSSNRGRQLWYPPYYLTSDAGDHAMGYSKQDWMTLTKKYHHKNQASVAYFEQKNWILKCHYKQVQESHKRGLAAAEQTTNRIYSQWQQELKHHFYLSEEQKQELDQLFIQTMSSIFKPVNPL